MKLFIEIVSCGKDRTKQIAPQNTWIKEWGHLIDYKFLLGRGVLDQQPDEWIMDVGDTWDEKVHKIIESCRRCLSAGYDYVFHVSLDCYPIVPRLVAHARTLNGRQYVGTRSGGGDFLGEAGFWMGRQAMQALVDQGDVADQSYEDLWIGQVMHRCGIPLSHEPFFSPSGDQTREIFPYEDPAVWQLRPEQCSVHLGRGSGTFQPHWMFDCHKSYMAHGDHTFERPGL